MVLGRDPNKEAAQPRNDRVCATFCAKACGAGVETFIFYTQGVKEIYVHTYITC